MVEGGPEMIVNQPEIEPTERLKQALSVFNVLYKGDGDLVRAGAERHGVQVVKGQVFDAPSPGNYNFRIPDGANSAQMLANARSVSVLCEDYRQFGQAVEATQVNPLSQHDAVIGIAGGAAQPEVNRFNALVELQLALAEANPAMRFTEGVHTGVCGGAEHFTGGQMSKVLNEGGAEAEKDKMVDFRTKLVTALQAGGIAPERITVGAAIVNGHEFQRWE